MKKAIFLIPLAGVVATYVALGATSSTTWDWKKTTKNKTINYCLLIGQTDHNDSQARTKGIRTALDTQPEDTETNPNVQQPKQGHKVIGTNHKESYTINEMSHRVCVADSGATWDQGTAIVTANSWYSKYTDKITMIISNNDGMAEGASFALNCPKGMPIFGYDSNESTLNMLKAGKIAGTINSNAPAQATIINLLACRLVDDPSISEENLFKGLNIRNPKTADMYKITDDSDKFVFGSSQTKPSGENYSGYITDILGNELKVDYDSKYHSLLVDSNKVTKKNVDDFLKPIRSQTTQELKSNSSSDKYNFFQCCYSKTDTYLTSTMNPLVSEVRKKMGVQDTSLGTMVYGNGNDEDKITNEITTKGKKKAYIINMTKTTNGSEYIKKIKDVTGSDFDKTPIIFYNRQPTGDDGLDYETMHANQLTYYVGFNAVSGATHQGEMIVDWLNEQQDLNFGK